MGREIGALFWGLLAALLALVAADASLRGSWFDDGSLPILAASFVAMAIMLATVSVAPRMRLSLQLLAIYFGIYLLLPGFNHASINRFPFFNFSYPEDIRTAAAAIVGLFLVAVLLAYAVAAASQALRRPPPRAYAVRANPALATILIVISLASLVMFIAVIGLSGAFVTRSSANQTGLDAAADGLLVALPRVLVFLPVIYATLLVAHTRERGLGWGVLAISLPILLIVNFPLAIARSQVFGAILLFAILVIDFRKSLPRIGLSLAFVFGALVAMPVLEHFTRAGGTFADFDPRQVASAYFRTGDFDGFQSVNNAVVYVERYGLEYGRQLLSALLFFVPRAFWPGKAQPTGSITAEGAGYSFTNISQPLPSEFYVDFGWPGVILGGFLLGYVFLRLDRWFDDGWMTDMRTRLVAGLMMGFGLPTFRGTLLGVLPPIILLAIGLWGIARYGMRRVDDAAAPAVPRVDAAVARYPGSRNFPTRVS